MRSLAALVVALLLLIASPPVAVRSAASGGEPPDQTGPASTVPPSTVPPSTVPSSTAPPSTANPLLPKREDVADCYSSLPPPDCGSEARGGTGQFYAFGAMMLGMVFVGWRIARGVRRRDRAVAQDA